MARKGKTSDAAATSLAELEAVLGHAFARPELLTLALTHRSFVYDAGALADGGDPADPTRDNEQMEFVGDAVLGLLAAEALWRRFPSLREGELTRLRAGVVSRKHLGAVGVRLGLGRWLRLGHTAEKNEGRSNAALFSNTIEAIIAALYLDGGLAVAQRFVEAEILGQAMAPADAERTHAEAGPATLTLSLKDHKTALQELLQAQANGRPNYRPNYRTTGEEGPDHRRTFHVEVRVGGAADAIAWGVGPTKKQAEQEAARRALQTLAGSEATARG